MEFVRQFPSELVSNVAEDTLLHLVIKTTIIVPHIFRAKFVHCSATIYTMHIWKEKKKEYIYKNDW